jgi:hypothetical protein
VPKRQKHPKIRTKLVAFDFSDDEFNSDRLQVLQTATPKLEHGPYVVQPGTPSSPGHFAMYFVSSITIWLCSERMLPQHTIFCGLPRKSTGTLNAGTPGAHLGPVGKLFWQEIGRRVLMKSTRR